MNLGDLEGGVKLESGSIRRGTFSSEGLKGIGAGVARDYTPWIKGYSSGSMPPRWRWPIRSPMKDNDKDSCSGKITQIQGLNLL